MEKMIQRTIEKEDPVRSNYDFIEVSNEQRELTARHILPYREDIIADARSLREKVDRGLQKDVVTRKRLRDYGKVYPNGLCGEIRNAWLEQLPRHLFDSSSAGFWQIRQFLRSGGLMSGFWGVDSGRYFQNAIQLGSSILDVANDTVDRSKEPVVFYDDYETAPIKNLEDFESFADIAELYWKDRIYPNTIFPYISPYCPLLVERELQGQGKTDKVGLFFPAHDMKFFRRKNANSVGVEGRRFESAHRFIFSSKYSHRKLPDSFFEEIVKNDFLKDVSQRYPHVFTLSGDPSLFEERFNHFYHEGEDIDSLVQEIQVMREITELMNRRGPIAVYPKPLESYEI